MEKSHIIATDITYKRKQITFELNTLQKMNYFTMLYLVAYINYYKRFHFPTVC